MAEMAVPHKDSKDELWLSEETIFKQTSHVRSCPWFDKAHGGMPIHSDTHTQPEEKGRHGWIQVPQRAGEWSVEYIKSGWPVVGGF